ncbi:hypothetical protein F4818DRAFT_237281 [Hypoxylon cercidicola]|nr:hypothetical protein F4818DRAFT_237281 [Hypoxylon cercidicola]
MLATYRSWQPFPQCPWSTLLVTCPLLCHALPPDDILSTCLPRDDKAKYKEMFDRCGALCSPRNRTQSSGGDDMVLRRLQRLLQRLVQRQHHGAVVALTCLLLVQLLWRPGVEVSHLARRKG